MALALTLVKSRKGHTMESMRNDPNSFAINDTLLTMSQMELFIMLTDCLHYAQDSLDCGKCSKCTHEYKTPLYQSFSTDTFVIKFERFVLILGIELTAISILESPCSRAISLRMNINLFLDPL